MDMESVRLMNSILLETFADRTVIAIVHQLSTVLDFDQIIVMENGRVIEMGAPKELMLRDSAFKKLLQTGES
jgi:ABC-type multidrug transport system fused ATPase/permease subunit